MELLEYIKKNYKTPNVAVLRTLGASEELIEYLTNTPWNTNMKVVESLINKGDGGNGIKSITISPAITTTPALDSLFPVYYEDLTEEQKRDGVSVRVTVPSGTLTGGVTFTATPTSDWYMIDLQTGEPTVGEKGMPIHTSATPLAGKVTADYACADRPDAPEEAKSFRLHILIKEE